MLRTVKAGLLPFYIELYDRVRPEVRSDFAPLFDEIEAAFKKQGVEIVREEICCIKPEFHAAIDRLDKANVDVIISLHLAYSPSLESIEALTKSKTPLLMLDTTMDRDFGLDTNAERIMFNHGIHGVQDLASVLRRHNRPYTVIAGHMSDPRVVARAAAHVHGVAAARRLKGMNVLRIGPSFTGMGDFFVDSSVLKKVLGINVIQQDTAPLASECGEIGDDLVRAEMESDRENYLVEVSEAIHRRSVRAGLALEQLIEKHDCAACSFNFLAFDSGEGPLSTVPFLGACKIMANGFGYAGEGDVVTAALVGALNGHFLVNFTEMFCPDWKGNSVFLSHMGEFNPACANGRARMVEKPFPWTNAENPAILTGAMKPGAATLVNLAPRANDSFAILAAPVTVLGDTTDAEMRSCVRGWIQPDGDLGNFLEWYSNAGGTHHCALVHDQGIGPIKAFAETCGLIFESHVATH
jgi:L-arabinose isomerase